MSQIDGQRSKCDLADFHSHHTDIFTWYRHEAFVHYGRGVARRGVVPGYMLSEGKAEV